MYYPIFFPVVGNSTHCSVSGYNLAIVNSFSPTKIHIGAIHKATILPHECLNSWLTSNRKFGALLFFFSFKEVYQNAS